MPIPQMSDHPVVSGMAMDGYSLLYAAPWDVLPCPGLALTPSFLGDIDPGTVDAVAAARKATFDHDQLHGTMHPVTQHDVGFVVDVRGVTLYSQFQLPNYEVPIDEVTYVPEPDPFDALFPLAPYAPMGARPAWPMPTAPHTGAAPFPPEPGTSPPAGWYPSR